MSVTNSGAGIPTDKLNEIFDAFYTTKRQGTGLGLSIARTIIETYGGKISAENGSGGGAVFRFTLPLCPSFRRAIGDLLNVVDDDIELRCTNRQCSC